MSGTNRVCDTPECESRAVFGVKHIVANKASTQYLCARCAKAKGITAKPPASIDLSDLLVQMGEGQPSSAAKEPCGFCGLAFVAFTKTGRLGCAHCYTSFEADLRKLLTRIHQNSQHVGKVYLPPNPDAAEVSKRVTVLRRRLSRAVAVEDFERAAALRDEIRELEGAGQYG